MIDVRNLFQRLNETFFIELTFKDLPVDGEEDDDSELSFERDEPVEDDDVQSEEDRINRDGSNSPIVTRGQNFFFLKFFDCNFRFYSHEVLGFTF